MQEGAPRSPADHRLRLSQFSDQWCGCGEILTTAPELVVRNSWLLFQGTAACCVQWSKGNPNCRSRCMTRIQTHIKPILQWRPTRVAQGDRLAFHFDRARPHLGTRHTPPLAMTTSSSAGLHDEAVASAGVYPPAHLDPETIQLIGREDPPKFSWKKLMRHTGCAMLRSCLTGPTLCLPDAMQLGPHLSEPSSHLSPLCLAARAFSCALPL